MLLTNKDRLLLLQILPQQGDFTTIKIVRKLREDLSFTEAEHKEYKIEVLEGRVNWKVDGSKDIEIGPKAHEIITKEFVALNDQKALREVQLDLYERFVNSEK